MWRGGFQLRAQAEDLRVELQQRRAQPFEHGHDPGRQMLVQSRPGLRHPPVRRGGQSMAHQEAAALRLHPAAMAHQLLALARDVPPLFLGLGGHADDRQRIAVALHIAVQPQAQRARVAPIGLYPAAAFVQRLRTDDVAVRSSRQQRAMQAEAEATAFINDMHLLALFHQ